jgi:hypothetical protein
LRKVSILSRYHIHPNQISILSLVMSHHRKSRARHQGSNSQQLQMQPQFIPQPSDYETDTFVLNVDNLPPPPKRSNDELNLQVLRRHDPSIVRILSIAPYTVLYNFVVEDEQPKWDKNGIEGTLFVCQLEQSEIGADRFSVMILNRRGLDNFRMELLSPDAIEITDDYLILQMFSDGEIPQVYGVWIFTEPEPASTAKMYEINCEIIMECAAQAEKSRLEAEARVKAQQNGNGHTIEADDEAEDEAEQTEEEASVPMGRSLSLRELFGAQREQDAAWSVHAHQSPLFQGSEFPSTQSNQQQPLPAHTQQRALPHTLPLQNLLTIKQNAASRGSTPSSQTPFGGTADTDFFRGGTPQTSKAKHAPSTGASQQPAIISNQPDVNANGTTSSDEFTAPPNTIEELFRKAHLQRQGSQGLGLG